MEASDENQEVELFCRQYLQLEQSPRFPSATILRNSAVQDRLYARLFAPDALRFAPPPRYQVRVLKQLLQRIEASISDWEEHGVSDDLASRLAELLAVRLPTEDDAARQKSYVAYFLSPPRRGPDPGQDFQTGVGEITLAESRSLISAAGTTGLRTWEAALHLGRFLCERPDVVRGKHVLELGAGTGYLSVLCARHLGAAHVLVTDGSEEVIAGLPENLRLNGLQGDAVSTSAVSVAALQWGHAPDVAWDGGRPVDVILGADVTYDKSLVGALVGTIGELWTTHPAADVIISATQRNEETFEAFLDACRKRGFAVSDVEFGVPPRGQQRGPFYDDSVGIRICRVSRAGD